jgi:hypothetical protein
VKRRSRKELENTIYISAPKRQGRMANILEASLELGERLGRWPSKRLSMERPPNSNGWFLNIRKTYTNKQKNRLRNPEKQAKLRKRERRCGDGIGRAGQRPITTL